MYKTLLDEFAMAAMQGDFASSNSLITLEFGMPSDDLQVAAVFYYRMADAMMKAREKRDRI